MAETDRPASGVFAGLSVAVLADGDFPSSGPARAALDSAGAVVCCDGAAAKLLAAGRVPDLAVGDGDSIPPDAAARMGPRFVPAPDQSRNDLAKALDAAFERGARGVCVLGAGGGRDDHFIANVSVVAWHAVRDPGVSMVTAAGRFDAVSGRRTFAAASGDTVSVFALLPGAAPSSAGLRWPLQDACMAHLHAGLSNEVCGEGGFTVESAVPVLVYRPHRP